MRVGATGPGVKKQREGAVATMRTAEALQLGDLIRSATIVDLSVTTSDNLPCSPPEGQRPAQFLMNWYTWPRGPYREFIQIHDDHTGTHIDAPCHFTPAPESQLEHATEFGSVTVDKLPFEQLMGPAAVVDVRHLIAGYPPGEATNLRESPVIRATHIREWESEHGEFERGEIVLFHTGWSDRYYLPYPEGFRYDRSHPAPGEDAIVHLYERGVRHIGIDARGIGLLQDDYTPHWAALGRGMVATENLTNLGRLPTRGAFFMFLPHKFEGATGGLGRAIAFVL
jgi:kynurenine formamidase